MKPQLPVIQPTALTVYQPDETAALTVNQQGETALLTGDQPDETAALNVNQPDEKAFLTGHQPDKPVAPTGQQVGGRLHKFSAAAKYHSTDRLLWAERYPAMEYDKEVGQG